MLIEINKNKKENTIEVTIEIPLILQEEDKKEKLFTSHVKEILKEKGYKIASCLGQATISNAADHKRKATWVFKLKDTPKKKPKKSRKKDNPFAVSKKKSNSNEE